MQIKEILKCGIEILKQNGIDEATIKSKILLAYVLNLTKEQLLIYDTKEVEENLENKYKELISEIVQGKPLKYITNKQEFMKLNFYVDENVLIPRQDTENIVEEVINICKKDANKKYKILDLCTGSGIVGISVAKYVPNAKVTQTDISSQALEIAKKNAIINKVEQKVEFINSNMFENISKNEKFDIIVSNPPYIKTDIIKSLDKEVQNEPKLALDGGKDGLKFYKIIIDNAYSYLNKQGQVVLEIGYDQKKEVTSLAKSSGKYINIYSKKDLNNNDRMVVFQIK